MERLLDLVTAGALSQAVAVAAELGIADRLASGPQTPAALAQATASHAPSLHRLLRALCVIDVCVEREDGAFALGPEGACLRSDAPTSLRGYAIWWGRHRWPAWAGLARSVATGRRAIAPGADGVGMRELDRDPAAATIFNDAMGALTRHVAASVVRACEFGGVSCIADIGGGYGELLGAALASRPALRGILFDQAHALEGARAQLARAGVLERCDVIAGDFFSAVPAADGYVLKTVIHDWDDAEAALILRNCRAAGGPAAKLWLVEQVLPERVTPGAGARAVVADLNMLVMLGGRERTAEEFRRLLRSARFSVARMRAAALGYCVIEAVAA